MGADDNEANWESEIAARLTKARVLEIQRVGGGRNSRVFRVATSAGIFALKQYPSLSDDPRDRLTTETRALAWMEEHGVYVVPRFIALERATNCALLSWVDGARIAEVGAHDVDQAADFLAEVERLRRTFTFPSPQLASEACLSGAEIVRQIRARMSRLQAVEGEPDLKAFLGREFSQRFEQLLSRANTRVSSAGIGFATELPDEQRALVPSDFGFHNALRSTGGRLTFLDFEYFGWDDPVKLVSDSLLHPGTPMKQDIQSRFSSAMKALYSYDRGFCARFAAFFPLFGLRWVLILLNEFDPQRWRRRALAGDTERWHQAKERQLRAARAALAELGDEGIK